MKIINLKISNVGGVEAFEIAPDGAHVVIGGPNGSGKSSVLRAIAGALGGGKERLQERVKRGAEKGEVVVDLGELVVRWRTDAEGRDVLAVESADGARYKSPQSKLDALFGARTFDPLRFFDANPAEQAKQLADLAGIDLAEFARRYAEAFEDRRMAGRQLKIAEGALASLPVPAADVPAEPIDTAPLVAEISEAGRRFAEKQAKVGRIADLRLRSSEADATARRLAEKSEFAVGSVEREVEREVENILSEMAAVQRRLEAAKVRGAERIRLERERIEKAFTESTAKASDLSKQAAVLESEVAGEGELPDQADVRDKLKAAEETNHLGAQAARYRDQKVTVANIQAEHARLNAEIESIRAEQAEAIAKAPIPVQGLGIEAGQVTYHGLPLANLSASERLRVSVGLGLAVNPEIRVMLIDRWNDLDDDSRQVVREMADEADCQIWSTVVGTKDEDITVVIREGKLVEP